MKKLGTNLMIVILVVVVCITALEALAISKGMNGASLTSTISVLVGIPAWFISRQVAQRGTNGPGKKST